MPCGPPYLPLPQQAVSTVEVVVASDLRPSYGATLPDPETLTRARADWSGALLTEDVIAANRHG